MPENPPVLQSQISSIHPSAETDHKLLLIKNLSLTIPVKDQESHLEIIQSVLDQLSGHHLKDLLTDCFSETELSSFREHITTELEIMNRVNRARMVSLIQLAEPGLRKAVHESLLLFDINPEEIDSVNLEKITGYDDAGKPIIETSDFKVFPSGAAHGIAQRERFLPTQMLEGTGGIEDFVNEEYPQFKNLKEQDEKDQNKPIIALTTIGSLGGIGHKFDSDMDAQVIVNTDPGFDQGWTDGDFLLALMLLIQKQARKHYFSDLLKNEDRKNLESSAKEELQANCSEGLSEEEIQVLHAVFPGTYHYLLERKIDNQFNSLPEDQRIEIFRQTILSCLREHPEFSQFISEIKQVYPFLMDSNPAELIAKCFTGIAAIGSKEALLKELSVHIQNRNKKHLKNNVGSTEESSQHTNDEILENLKQSPKPAMAIKEFLDWVASHCTKQDINKFPQILKMLCEEFPSSATDLEAIQIKDFETHSKKALLDSSCALITNHRNIFSQQLESQTEYNLLIKIQKVEEYLTEKYPDTEVHYFLNILRRMRSGDHTPFLVSPEGSQAYSLMLNDFLLNPATMIAGMTPLPFELPHHFRILAKAGIFEGEDWEFDDGEQNSGNKKALKDFPDWGHVNIPRSFFLKHVIPIFLRESEKVSHRNLPKALLNCWWVEMLLLQDPPDQELTSLTKLLFHPENRRFVVEQNEGAFVEEILKLEKEYPELCLDPWWLKFSEMLTRFKDPLIQTEMIFCFAQHMRLQSIIEFETTEPLFVEKEAAWRRKAMVDFYKAFFPEEKQKKLLVGFAQGRDDVANFIEKQLKTLFVQSMKRVERHVCNEGRSKSLNRLLHHLGHAKKTEDNHQQLQQFLKPLLDSVFQRVPIEDRRVLNKLRNKIPLNALEKIQARSIYLDHQNLKKVSEQILEHAQQDKTKLHFLENVILKSRVQVAGDVLENVIFKYHFERNFEKKTHQIQLPISKSLSIPRPSVIIRHQPKSDLWKFLAMVPRTGTKQASRGNALEMFEANMTEGIARCVFSGYIGFTTREMTSFQKEAARMATPVTNNPFASDDALNLAQSIQAFFQPHSLSPSEVLQNLHYVREIFMVCNANRFMNIALIIRDNLGKIFVIDYDLSVIPYKSRNNEVIGEEHQPPEVFFNRLKTSKAREFFLKEVGKLKIPLDLKRPPHFGFWINTRNFKIPVNSKYHRIYLEGIMQSILPVEGKFAPWSPYSPKIEKTFDEIGKKAIEQHHEKLEQERKRREKELQRVQRDSRKYLDKVLKERAARIKELEG